MFVGGASYHSEGLTGGSGGDNTAGQSCDPLTGGGAYTSGSGGVVTGSRQGPPPEDPWMQGAYRSDETMDTSSGGVVSNKYFPQQDFVFFDSVVKPEPVIKKLKEFNAVVPGDQRVDESVLEQLPSLTSSSSPDPGLVSALLTVLQWPEQHTFPALDILRSSLLNSGAVSLITEKSSLDQVFSSCLRHVASSSPAPAQMLSLRCLTNLFHCEAGHQLMRTYRDSVVSRVMEKLFPVPEDNKNIQIAAATLMLNYAVSVNQKFDDETQVQLLSVLSINFLTFITDWEARFRVLVGVGTLLASSPEAVEYGKTLELSDGVRSWRMLEGSAKVSECAQFIESIL